MSEENALEDAKSKSRFGYVFEKLIAPVVVGVCVLLGQWLIQPMISKEQNRDAELIRLRSEAFIKTETMALLLNHWVGEPENELLIEDIKKHVRYSAIYNNLSQLRLVSKDDELFNLARKIISATWKKNRDEFNEAHNELVAQLRSELHGSQLEPK